MSSRSTSSSISRILAVVILHPTCTCRIIADVSDRAFCARQPLHSFAVIPQLLLHGPENAVLRPGHGKLVFCRPRSPIARKRGSARGTLVAQWPITAAGTA